VAISQQWSDAECVDPNSVEHKYYEIVQEDDSLYFEFSNSVGKPITLIEK
jgi:hypothetical protein